MRSNPTDESNELTERERDGLVSEPPPSKARAGAVLGMNGSLKLKLKPLPDFRSARAARRTAQSRSLLDAA